MGKRLTLAAWKKSLDRGERVLERMWDGVSAKRRAEIEAETLAVMEWELLPIGTGPGTRDATLRERLMLFHARYCLRKYPLWDVVAMWAKWEAGGGPPYESAEADLCHWLDSELNRADRHRRDEQASVASTLTVVLILMREQFRANLPPALPSWDEDAERAATLIARAAREKANAEARDDGEPVPQEHEAIRRYFELSDDCPRAFFAPKGAAKPKGARRGNA